MAVVQYARPMPEQEQVDMLQVLVVRLLITIVGNAMPRYARCATILPRIMALLQMMPSSRFLPSLQFLRLTRTSIC